MSAMIRPRGIRATTNVPGWLSTPYNLITDTDGPLDDPDKTDFVVIPVPVSEPGLESIGTPAIWFTSNLVWMGSSRPGGNDPVADAAAVMHFNQIGVMSGPAIDPNVGGPNKTGVVTVTLVQLEQQQDGSIYPNTRISTTIDLTDALPGQMYWSDPFADNFDIFGTVYTGQAGPILNQQIYYYIAIAPPNNYTMYTARSCTVRNGGQWGSTGYGASVPVFINPDHNYTAGVDLNLINYRDLGEAPIKPIVTLGGRVMRRGELGAPPVNLTPRISLTGRVHRAGAFEGINNLVGNVTFANPSGMVGGSLWKPAKLCTG